MKAYRIDSKTASIFRIDRHLERFNISLDRMCMPNVSLELFSEALKQLISLDLDWIAHGEGSSLYIRPFVIATEPKLGVKVAEEYKFMIVSGPVGPYYSNDLKVKVEKKFVRAAEGGTGFAKCGGNYGGAFYPTAKAREEGFDQVLWTDACEHHYIEESGTMNIFFVIDGKLVTPPLSSSILDGVTRNSIQQLAADWNLEFIERKISLVDLINGISSGKITEAFGTGTAAVVAPIRSIGIDGKIMELPGYSDQSILYRIKSTLNDIRTNKVKDIHNWNTIIHSVK